MVVAGRHRRLGNEVAIKQLNQAMIAEQDVRKRFLGEARLLAGLDHPHIVRIHDFVEVDDVCLLIMERLTGGTVRAMGHVSLQQACAIAVATASGLEYAHGHGILHRDVKPENIMFSGEGVLKVTDFGIAKILGGDQTTATMTGFVMGTPNYIAPEQVLGGELTPATDVYALGTLLYELIARQSPFEKSDALIALYRHAHEDPRPLLDVAPDAPVGLARIVDRAIARAPEDRYQSTRELGEAIEEVAWTMWGRDWQPHQASVAAAPRPAPTVAAPPAAPPTSPAAAPPTRVAAPAPPTALAAPTSPAAVPMSPAAPAGQGTPPSSELPAARRPLWRRPQVLVPAAVVVVLLAVLGGVLATRGGGGSSGSDVLSASSDTTAVAEAATETPSTEAPTTAATAPPPGTLDPAVIILTTDDLPGFTADAPNTHSDSNSAIARFTRGGASLVVSVVVADNDQLASESFASTSAKNASTIADFKAISVPALGDQLQAFTWGENGQTTELFWREGRVLCAASVIGGPTATDLQGWAQTLDTKVKHALGT